MIAQTKALLEEAKREAERAQRLADQKSGFRGNCPGESCRSRRESGRSLIVPNAGLKLRHKLATREKAKAAVKPKRRPVWSSLQNGQAGSAGRRWCQQSQDLDESQSESGCSRARTNVRVTKALKSRTGEAQLKLDWTKDFAPCDGYMSRILDVNEGQFVCRRGRR